MSTLTTMIIVGPEKKKVKSVEIQVMMNLKNSV